MTPEQFAYWLQGYAELNAEPPTAEQWRAIRDHLDTVFDKITPRFDPTPKSGRLCKTAILTRPLC